MRNVPGADLGDLRKSKMSEMASEVRCHNHAYQVALQRQLNQWHREQVVAVNKLSKMQQRSFQNLIRVENEKRKLQRRARIKRQKNMQQKLREQAALEREDAMRRSLDLKLTIQRQNKKRKRTRGMAFTLPASVEVIEEESSIVEGEAEDGVRDNESQCKDEDENSYARQTESGVGSSSKSEIQDGSSSKFMNNNYLPSVESSRQSTDDTIFLAQALDSIEKKTDSSLYIRTATKLPDIEIRSDSMKPIKLTEEIQSTQTGVKSKTILPPINSSPNEETLKSNSSVDSASSSSSFSPKKERANDKVKQKEQDITDDLHKYHIGIANRSFKIPEYEPPAVTSVTKYHKNTDGSFTSTDVSVRPAKEDFKLPSRKPYYLISKALGWEKQREVERERKVRQFIHRQKEIEEGANKISERNDILSTPEMPYRDGYQRTRRQSTYITLNDSIHHKALLGVLGDKNDLHNCRYLRIRDGVDNTEDQLQYETEAGSSRTISPTKRREKLSSWGKLSSVKAPPHKKDPYYYVSLL